jgi:uncharacterized protein YcgI (DUF1989 family)
MMTKRSIHIEKSTRIAATNSHVQLVLAFFQKNVIGMNTFPTTMNQNIGEYCGEPSARNALNCISNLSALYQLMNDSTA